MGSLWISDDNFVDVCGIFVDVCGIVVDVCRICE